MRISYLVTCHEETDTLDRLLMTLETYISSEDEILILEDNKPPVLDYSTPTQQVIKKHLDKHNADKREWVFHYQRHSLDRNYGAHKNFGNEICTGDWVFQIDGDEIPNPNLIVNLKTIIEANPKIDLIFVPRINDFIGVTPVHAAQWGWRLTPCNACDGRPIVNWPDYQSRCYKREPARIRWDRRLHEKIEGHTSFATLPAETDLALYHDKTIETQIKTNVRYNEWFTAEENRGHNVFDQKTTGSNDPKN